MTIDSALNELYPIHQIGSDGFKWWIGQVEEPSHNDPKQSGRCKVRIVGIHPKSCSTVKNEDLPWAVSTFPVTNPHQVGVCSTVSDQLDAGIWVVGFFLDNDHQHPCIIGSIGGVAHSSDKELEGEDPSKQCNSFESFIPKNTLVSEQPDPDGDTLVAQHVTMTGNQQIGVEQEANSVLATKNTNLQTAQEGDNSESNTAGTKVCVTRPSTCKQDLKSKFTRLFSEMLYEIQRNDGKLGTYLVNEMSSGLFDSIDVGREYVDKAVLIMRTFVANVKGYVLEKIREAVKWITKAILKPDKGGRGLNAATDKFNEWLALVGCEMADLADRLAKWLEDIIFGYLFNIYKQTACQIDEFVQGLLNKIQSLMNSLLENILGPIQDILGAIAAPLNMIGDAINKVLKLLGIQCNGPTEKCQPKTKICTDNSGDKVEKNFLDRLLENLDSWGTGQDWTQYTCVDVFEGKKLLDTGAAFVGGVQEEDLRVKYFMKNIRVKEGETAIFTVERSGVTDIASSISYRVSSGTALKDVDFEDVSGVLGFAPGETSKTIQVDTYQDNLEEYKEDFYMNIVPETPGEGTDYPSFFFNNIARCDIWAAPGTGGDAAEDDDTTIPTGTAPISSNPEFPSINVNNPSNWEDVVEPETTGSAPTTAPTYSITADKTVVKEGEFVTFTIVTTNVKAGTTFDYSLVGSGITPSDIVSNTLRGSFVVEDLGDHSAKVVIGIKEDANINEPDETLIFGIPGTGATASVRISADLTGLSDEDKKEIEDLSENDPGDKKIKLPVIGEIITDDGGGIIHIPIDDPGTRYTEPPAVFITGEGYGATCEVLLDNDGFAKEIRIVDPGFDYKLNVPTAAKKECIIDAFTMGSPGRGYTSVPTVYINGSKDVAEAEINTDGQVIAVKIKDRTLTFNSYPEVIISGGGGLGARFIPSFVCLDPTARVKVGSAKVGTGSYIDCP